jgi:hypothetical protein
MAMEVPMKPSARVLVGLAVLGIATPYAFGLGADHGKEELKRHVIGGQTPVHGYFVNWEDVFFFAGDAKAFNQFVDAYSKFKDVKLQVVIHAGTTNAKSPWDKAPRDLPADWSFYIWNTGTPLSDKPAEKPVGNPAPTRVDVWVGTRLKVADLCIAANIDVEAAKDVPPDGEIAKFVAERKKPKQ